MTIFFLVNGSESLTEREKNSWIISVFIFTSVKIYSGRDAREKKDLERRNYLQQVLQDLEELTSAATQILITSNEKYYLGHTAHTHALMEEEVNFGKILQSPVK